MSPPPPFSLAGCCVDLCASRQLLLTSTEAEGRFHGLSGPPVLPQPGPLQPELMGKAGGAPYFWDCHSGGVPGFPVHGPAAGQYSPAGGWVGGGLVLVRPTGWLISAVCGHCANGLRWMIV